MPALRESYTTVLVRAETVADRFVTESYEAGWAHEAVVFAESVEGTADMVLHVQISADGMAWHDEGTRLELKDGTSGAFARVSHFGNWLRLRAEAPEAGGRRLTLTAHFKA